MDCKTARMLIEFALPRCGELDAQESQALDNHLRDCGECAQAARVEFDADRHVSRAMRDVPVPSGLRERTIAAKRWRNGWKTSRCGVSRKRFGNTANMNLTI